MTLPKFKPIDNQLPLFDRELYENVRGHGDARVVLGDYVEELTAKLFKGKRFATDCRCPYCPDVYSPRTNTYFECKSCGVSKEFIVYAGRLEKDVQFASLHNLQYCIWHHSAKIKAEGEPHTTASLKALFFSRMIRVYVVDFSTIHKIAQDCPIVEFKGSYGSCHEETYRTGYRIPLHRFEGEKFDSVEWDAIAKFLST